MMPENVTCARIPASTVASLAGLRRSEGISILAEGDHSWAFFRAGDAEVLQALFPIDGVEFFERRVGSWYRSGQWLPSFIVPDSGQAVAIDRAIFPGPFQAIAPGEAGLVASKFRLVRQAQPQPTTAAICPLVELGRWADAAPTSQIESLRGAILGDHALLIGRVLPAWPGSTRYWGNRVLIPIGFQVRPSLPEEALLDALGSTGLEIFRFAGSGQDLAVEPIPYDVLRPLSRAGVRLALRARSL